MFTDKFKKPAEDEFADAEEEYVELDSTPVKEETGKIIVRPFVIDDFSDVKDILESIRQNNTIALINIKPLKEKDIIELKRAVNKLKKTCDAMKGEIAGFGDDFIVVVPEFAQIYRPNASRAAKDTTTSLDE